MNKFVLCPQDKCINLPNSQINRINNDKNMYGQTPSIAEQ